MADMRNLELRDRSYYAIKAIPRPLWAAMGKRRLVKSLQTREHHAALRKRASAIAEFDRAIAKAEAGEQRAGLEQEAMEWRAVLAPMEPQTRAEQIGFVADAAESVLQGVMYSHHVYFLSGHVFDDCDDVEASERCGAALVIFDQAAASSGPSLPPLQTGQL